MRQIDSKLVEQAIAIIGTDGISDVEIEQRVFALANEKLLARRLIDWLPEAFAIVFIPHIAKVNLPTTFSAKSKQGDWIEFQIEMEPIFLTSIKIGADMFHSGPRDIFKNIVLRSSMIATVNKALNHGVSLDGATLSGPVMIGIPAEFYLPPLQPCRPDHDPANH